MKPGNTPSLQIVYKDDFVLVAVKPQGMPSQPDPTGAPDALTLAAGGGTLYPVHRLDRVTGGIMVFARTRAAAASLSAQFRDHGGEEIGKRYLAVVSGTVTGQLDLSDDLLRDARTGVARVVPTGTGGLSARLRALPLATATHAGNAVTLLEICLETGRFHQIRCQLSSHGYPILGDGKYGSRVRMPLALYAEALAFRHPHTGALVTFSAPRPTGNAWDLFADYWAKRAAGERSV